VNGSYFPSSDSNSQEHGISLYKYISLDSYTLQTRLTSNANNLPLANDWKAELVKHFTQPHYAAIYILENPTILFYPLSNGEIKLFIITRDGFIFNQPFQTFWYSCFSFLTKSSSPHSWVFQLHPETLQFLIKGPFLIQPESTNYTHFFIDCIGQSGFFRVNHFCESLLQLQLPCLQLHHVTWQENFIKQFSLTSNIFPSKITNKPIVLNPPLLYYPYVSQPFHVLNSLRKSFLEHHIALSDSLVSNLPTIIFCTRFDSRRRRIRNINEIEELVQAYNGIVIDPSTYTHQEKLNLFSSAKIVLAESSGTLNYSLYCPPHSFLIHLVDPSLTLRPEFIYGGWLYNASSPLHSRVRYILGHSPEPLPCSPVWSCVFDKDMLVATINSVNDLLRF